MSGIGAKHRVLVVEDEFMIMLDIESLLRRSGYEVVGPAGNLAEALCAARERAHDLALLDVNLGDHNVFPVADVLADRGIPFAFLTGYGEEILPDRHRGRPLARKPFTEASLLATLTEILSAGHTPPGG
jgi:DNA-binding response OmpR family regulator